MENYYLFERTMIDFFAVFEKVKLWPHGSFLHLTSLLDRYEKKYIQYYNTCKVA